MSNSNSTLYNNLFSSIISDIKSYSGNDPLVPWIRGIKKMKDSLPFQLLKEKLPRFLQKCAETFQTDRRYSNDLRYLRVWLQLMDFVDDPKAVLTAMEMNRIGTKKSLFYQAYALYYEKMKKFGAAEKIYHLGVQNLAEPADELQKAYEQFIYRLKRHKCKRNQYQGGETNEMLLCEGRVCSNHDEVKGKNENPCRIDVQPEDLWLDMQPKSVDTDSEMDPSRSCESEMSSKESNHKYVAEKTGKVELLNDELLKNTIVSNCGGKSYLRGNKVESDDNRKHAGDNAVVVKFVDTAIVGKSNAEDTRHHGLVEPTINTKEAMKAISSMFREPLDPSVSGRTSDRNQPQTDKSLNIGSKVFTDKSIETEVGSPQKKPMKDLVKPSPRFDYVQPIHEPFQIYIDDEESNEEEIQIEESTEVIRHGNGFAFPSPSDLPSECSKDLDASRVLQAGREDTIIYRFVGSTISEEPEVENVWHHGLVDPTVNLKEAMNDINGMFGKPIEFASKSRSKKQDRITDAKNSNDGFLILPDDELDNQKAMNDVNGIFQEPIEFPRESQQIMKDDVPDHVKTSYGGFFILPDEEFNNEEGSSLSNLSARNESGLFEQTLCTKEAMAEINKMFAMTMDF